MPRRSRASCAWPAYQRWHRHPRLPRGFGLTVARRCFGPAPREPVSGVARHFGVEPPGDSARRSPSGPPPDRLVRSDGASVLRGSHPGAARRASRPRPPPSGGGSGAASKPRAPRCGVGLGSAASATGPRPISIATHASHVLRQVQRVAAVPRGAEPTPRGTAARCRTDPSGHGLCQASTVRSSVRCASPGCRAISRTTRLRVGGPERSGLWCHGTLGSSR